MQDPFEARYIARHQALCLLDLIRQGQAEADETVTDGLEAIARTLGGDAE